MIREQQKKNKECCESKGNRLQRVLPQMRHRVRAESNGTSQHAR